MGTKILSAEGHEVTTVSNGQAALKSLKDSVPDLIVADVFMPGKTGYEVCQFIKSDPKLSGIPVVLIVAPMEPYDSTEGHRVKADSLVTKPLESSNLVTIVEQLLAAAKKSAPPPAPPSQPAPAPAAVVESGTQSGVFADSIPTRTAPVELEIPEEMRQQPVSIFSDLLEPPVVPAAAPAVAEEVGGLTAALPPLEAAPAMEAAGEPSAAVEAEPLFPLSESEPAGIGEPLIAALGASAQQESAEPEMFAAPLPIQESAPTAPPSWMASSDAVTEDDKKLFEPPPPDWQGLVSMVQEEADEPLQPLPVKETGMAAVTSQSDTESATAAAVAPPENESGPSQLQSEEPSDSEPGENMVSSPSLQGKSVSAESPELSAPAIAPLDYATVEQIVRETVEELMPEIVDRIAKATGISFEKKG
jgi:CheY-like chemotaxis protein